MDFLMGLTFLLVQMFVDAANYVALHQWTLVAMLVLIAVALFVALRPNFRRHDQNFVAAFDSLERKYPGFNPFR